MPKASQPPLTDSELSAVRLAIEARRNLPGALLPILHAIQDQLGWVPAEAVALIRRMGRG